MANDDVRFIGPKRGKGVASGRITVLGANELIAKFEGIKSYAALRTGHTVYELADIVWYAARDLVPFDTGNLQSGIHKMKIGPYDWAVEASSAAGDGGNGNANQGEWGKRKRPKNDPAHEYANYVEFGTSKMSAKPLMRPAFAAAYARSGPKMKKLARELEQRFSSVAL